jgi:hypothetical protein
MVVLFAVSILGSCFILLLGDRPKLNSLPMKKTVLVFLVFLSNSLYAERPNIILCMADDLGWGDVGFNGNDVVLTPELDRMAKAGMRFERFYAAAPVCSPTRGSVLSGRHPSRYGIPTANQGHLKREEITIAEVLREQGYATGHFGKWHLGTLAPDYSGKKGRDSTSGSARSIRFRLGILTTRRMPIIKSPTRASCSMTMVAISWMVPRKDWSAMRRVSLWIKRCRSSRRRARKSSRFSPLFGFMLLMSLS